jgi:hypothetical protein
MSKKNPGKRLAKQINGVTKLPGVLDAFVKDHPWLNEDESFVKSCLAVKRTIQELKLPLNLIVDVAQQFMGDDSED